MDGGDGKTWGRRRVGDRGGDARPGSAEPPSQASVQGAEVQDYESYETQKN